MRRIEHSWVDDRAGEERSLGGTELRDAGVKIRTRRGLRAVHAVAPLDHVQVQLEDPRLRQLGLEPPRDDQLAQLANRVFRRRQVEVFRELLRDGAPAAQQSAARPVDDERFLQLFEVDAFVLPERIVFSHQHGAFQLG